MVVGLLTIDLFIPGAQSLKEKRMVLDALGFKVLLFRSDHEPR